MPQILLFVCLLGTIAWTPATQASHLNPDETWSALQSSWQAAHRLAPSPQPEPISEESYRFFLELVQSGIELPHALIRRHTLIAQPYGRFQAIELRPLNADLHLIVLRQTDTECIRHFLLTGSRFKTIDQVLIAENCQSDRASTLAGTVYRFRGEQKVEQLEVLLPTESSPQEVIQAFSWTAEGRIQRIDEGQ
jgi:hypothetical protein